MPPASHSTVRTALMHSSSWQAFEGGVQQYLYEPGDAEERYFLVFWPVRGNSSMMCRYPIRNMTMTALAAELPAVEEEKATLLSDFKVRPRQTGDACKRPLIKRDTGSDPFPQYRKG